MKGKHFEEMTVGEKFESLSRTVTETDIVNFVCLAGFTEELFTSMEYIHNRSIFPKRIAPGALTFSLAEGLAIQSGLLHDTGLAFLGLTNMRVNGPVFKDDTIQVEIEVIDKRETSKGDRGVVTFLHRVHNQHDETVMDYTVKRMLRKKGEPA